MIKAAIPKTSAVIKKILINIVCVCCTPLLNILSIISKNLCIQFRLGLAASRIKPIPTTKIMKLANSRGVKVEL